MNRAQGGVPGIARQRRVIRQARRGAANDAVRQSGVISLEAVVVMGVLLFAMAIVGTWIKANADEKDNQNAADNLNTVFQQALTWFNQNYTTVQAAANPSVTYPWATFMNGTTTVSQTNVYGQQYSLRVFKEPTSGQLDVMVVTTGGSVIKEGDLRSIARILGGAGGYVSSLTPANATGAMGGWNAVMTNFGGSPGGGHLAAAGFFQSASAVSNYLSRVVVPGNPQANQMETAIDMNANNLNNASTVSAQKIVTPTGNSVQVGNSFYAADTANSFIRQNGSLSVQNLAGAPADVNAREVIAAGNLWASNGTVTAAFMHSTGSLQVDGGAQVNGSMTVNGTLTAGSTLTANQFVQVNGFAVQGSRPCNNGSIGNSGSGPLFCQSGVWTALGSMQPRVSGIATGDAVVGPYNWCFMQGIENNQSDGFGLWGVFLQTDGGPDNRTFAVHNSKAGAQVWYACF
ncbi:shufflon system plasmid conjugative transfer pilus tip adhesin PilV [Paraburkholderia humisilvae]|uniref:Bacterial shufflon protein N-terminal domain-containing protein n=1 Tax=Paraburkholderia humisilvae TaxID=627669 RepID=A0A6J5DRG1_9BURK|nr:shufflon system plasmid conjugative transfer pilus tip adhesin PilV [Paraburkholderia humisilvae]CAB3755871.1 hypothetical protein LMG29542_02717 [Paraburkholderia humisilvae]